MTPQELDRVILAFRAKLIALGLKSTNVERVTEALKNNLHIAIDALAFQDMKYVRKSEDQPHAEN